MPPEPARRSSARGRPERATAVLEALLAIWCAGACIAAVRTGFWSWAPWPALFAAGFAAATASAWRDLWTWGYRNRPIRPPRAARRAERIDVTPSARSVPTPAPVM